MNKNSTQFSSATVVKIFNCVVASFLFQVALAQVEPDNYCGMPASGRYAEANGLFKRSTAIQALTTQIGPQWMTSKDTLNVLIVFVQFPDDNFDPQYSLWPKGQPPTFLKSYIDSLPSQMSTNGNLTHYFREMSRGKFTLIGKARHVITPHTRQWYLNNGWHRWIINKEVLDTMDAYTDFSEFDRWKRYGEYDIRKESDGWVDMVFMIYRKVEDMSTLRFEGAEASLGYNWYGGPTDFYVDNGRRRIGHGHPVFGHPGSGTTSIIGGAGDSWYGLVPYRPQIHEFAHHWMTNGTNYGHNGGGFWAMLNNWAFRANNQFQSCSNSFERELVGWITPDSIYQTTTGITLTDYVTTGRAVKIKVPGSNPDEFFRLEYHTKTSQFDTPEMYDVNAKGLYILHQSGVSDPENQLRLLPADGRWSWLTDEVAYPAYYPSGLPIYEKSSVDRVNGYDDSRLVPLNWTGPLPQPVLPNPNWIHFYRDRQTNQLIEQTVFRGDGRDAFSLAKNNLFTPWSNPNSQNISKQTTNVAVEITNENVQSGTLTFNIYIDNTACVSLPPSKPQDVRAIFSSPSTVSLTWASNIEPDMPPNGGGYDLYRSIYYDGATLSYSKVNSSLLSSPTFTDNPSIPTGIPAGKDVYWRYNVKAKDSLSKYSVPSEDFWLFIGKSISGTIANTTTWDANRIVVGNVTVNSGATLTISPGTTVKFATGTNLTVNGILNTQGTSSSPIIFTSTGSTSPSSWGSIKFDGVGANGSNLNYITMQYGTDIQFLNGANGTLQNSIIKNCNRGVYVYNAKANIQGNSFQDNLTDGITCNASGYTHEIHVNTITKTTSNPRYHQDWGINVGGTSYGKLSQNSISGYNWGMWIGGGPTTYFDKNPNLPYNYPNNHITGCNNALTVAYGGSLHNDVYYYMWYSGIHNNQGYDLYAYQSGSIYSRYDYFGGGNPSSYHDQSSTIDVLYPLSYDPWGGLLRSQLTDNSAKESQLLAKSTLSSAIPISAEDDDNVDKEFEFEQQKNYTGAIEHYQGLLKRGEVSRKTLGALAHFGAEAENKEVTNYFETLKKTKNEHQPFVMELLTGLYVRQGENQKSAALYDEIIKAFPNTYHEKLAWLQKFYYALHVEKDNAKALRLLSTIKSKYSKDDNEGNIERAESIFGSAGELKKKGSEEHLEQPITYELLQNYPNPFNPSTIMNYQLKEVSHVTLRVYDMLGREVATLVNGMKEAGYHTATFDGARLSSGIYFTRMTVQPQEGSPIVQVKKMLLTK